jgi:hypothetical protein
MWLAARRTDNLQLFKYMGKVIGFETGSDRITPFFSCIDRARTRKAFPS